MASLMTGCALTGVTSKAEVIPPSEPGIVSAMQSRLDTFAGEAPPADVMNVALEGAEVQAATVERLVIRTATLSMTVKDPAASVEEISQLAEEMGGFVVSSTVYQTVFGDPQIVADQGSITIRVPSERFEEALKRLKAAAVEVQNENKQGEDVTQQYTDLESRLRNLEAAEAELREIMGSAVRTEDVLAVYAQLVQIRGEIETIKGQMQYFEQSSAFASIGIELIPDIAEKPADFGKWLPWVTARESLESLVRSLQFLADAVIRFTIAVLPILLIIGVPVWVVLRAIARRATRRASRPPASAA
jgi:hypothetical protein